MISRGSFINHIVVIGLVLAAWAAPSTGQTTDYVQTGVLPVDTPTDPRSVAMGESFVAIAGNPAAMMYNPAGLAGLTGVTASYAQRRNDWYSGADNLRYHSGNATVGVGPLTLGALFNRHDYGEIAISSSQYPDGMAYGEPHFDLYALGAGASLDEHWDVGFAAKMFNYSLSITRGNGYSLSTTPAWLFDAGVIYRLPGNIDALHMARLFSAGISLQNLGTKLKSSSTLQTSTGPRSVSGEMNIPLYIRMGVSFGLSQLTASESDLVPFTLLLTAELRSLLNGGSGQSSASNFWGVGLDTKMYEILSVRLGLYIPPYSSIYGMDGTPALRYGIGLDLPFERLGLGAPLAVLAEYAAIPANVTLPYYGFPGNVRSTLHVFSLGVRYTEDI